MVNYFLYKEKYIKINKKLKFNTRTGVDVVVDFTDTHNRNFASEMLRES